MEKNTLNTNKYKVTSDQLYKKCPPDIFKNTKLSSTKKKDPIFIPLGQQKVFDSISMAISIKNNGYNIFAMGESGVGKKELILSVLQSSPLLTAKPKDWAYVYNFMSPENPIALSFPAGKAKDFQKDVEKILTDLTIIVPAAFESDNYRQKVIKINQDFMEKQMASVAKVQEDATSYNIAIIKNNDGFVITAIGDDKKPLKPDAFAKLPTEKKANLTRHVKSIQNRFEKVMSAVPLLDKQKQIKINNLNTKIVTKLAKPTILKVRKKYKNTNIINYLNQMLEHTINNFSIFLPQAPTQIKNPMAEVIMSKHLNAFEVNVIVDNSEILHNTSQASAPVVILDNPNYSRLFGKIEYISQFGALSTDFSLIKAGSLHQANGGYLILNARKILEIPWLWESLKHTIKNKSIQFLTPENAFSSSNFMSLEPQSIPLDVKIILIGESNIYYKLWQYDPEFQDLFKIVADFDSEVPYNDENSIKYADIIKKECKKENLLEISNNGLARAVEIGAKISGSQNFITTNIAKILNVVREATYLSKASGLNEITANEISTAYKLQKDRVSKYSDYWQKNIKDNIILVKTKGYEVGQINGLSVVTINDFMFGQPQRITASVYKGQKGVIDIERNVNLSGAIHSKGVMILQSFLNSKFGQEYPLSFSASLVFEQSYGGIDGDSATCAETLALLSALSNIPLKQNLAITGSMDQKGRVQPIGGVNHKIEGFFNVCKIHELDGTHGVVIPKSNAKDLMLSQEVVSAVEKGLFHVYAIENINDAIEIFTDTPSGFKEEDKTLSKDNNINSLIKKKWVKKEKVADKAD